MSCFNVLADMSFAYVDANIETNGLETNGSALPRIPPLEIGLGIVLENDIWRVRAELDHAARQDDIAPGELITEAYTLLNIKTRYKINDLLGLRVSINNLLDNEARQHTSFLKDVVPLPGRNFKISLSADF